MSGFLHLLLLFCAGNQTRSECGTVNEALDQIATRETPKSAGETSNGRPMRLAYFVPEFPGQTHIFFWREIIELEKLGVDVHLFSTRLPDKGIMSHSWTEAAVARTGYLTSLTLMDALCSIRHLPALLSKEVRAAVRADPGSE